MVRAAQQPVVDGELYVYDAAANAQREITSRRIIRHSAYLYVRLTVFELSPNIEDAIQFMPLGVGGNYRDWFVGGNRHD